MWINIVKKNYEENKKGQKWGRRWVHWHIQTDMGLQPVRMPNNGQNDTHDVLNGRGLPAWCDLGNPFPSRFLGFSRKIYKIASPTCIIP
jgi:hypothetical protein